MALPLSCHGWSSWWRIIIPLTFYYFLLSSRVVVVQAFQQPSPAQQPTIGSTLWAAAITTTTTIEVASVQVCRHKNCCKKSPYLLQSMANLLGNDRVEETGCLAQCEQGPNVHIQLSTTASPLALSSSSSPPLILHEMYDATTAAIQLEWATASAATTTPHEAEPLPKLLKAAAKLLEGVMSRSTSSSNINNHNMTPQLLGKYHVMSCHAMSKQHKQPQRHHFIESPIRILHIPFRHRCYLVPTIKCQGKDRVLFHLFGKWRRFGTFGSTTICVLCCIALPTHCKEFVGSRSLLFVLV
jgi:hypothetical protein